MDLTDLNLQSISSSSFTIQILGILQSKVDHILGHKANLGKYKKIDITPCILKKTRT
jgi:hypothetical protein